MASVTYDGAKICNAQLPEQVGEGNRWPHKRLSWQVVADLPGITRDSLRAAVTRSCGHWADVCGLTFYEGASSDANLIITTQREGPGGVLADCQLPYPGIGERSTRLLRIDEADAWAIADNPPSNRVGLVQVLTHELGHGIGLGHGPQGALMQPTYSARLGKPQAWDIVEARLRYGQRSTVPADPPGGDQPANQPGGRRRFDGRVLRGLLGQFPALGGFLGAAGVDPSRIPDIVELPDGLGGLFGNEGLELASIRLTPAGLKVSVLGKPIDVARGSQ